MWPRKAMLNLSFEKPEVTTVIRWLLRFILVIFLAWLVRQRTEQEEEDECEENDEVTDARARSNGLRSRGNTRPTRLQPRRDSYNAATRQRKGLSTSNDPADFDSNIDKAKPKEMWQPRRNGEPLVLKKQEETDGGPAERVAASASRSARDGRDQGPTLHGHERPVTFLTFNSESNLLFSCGKDKIVCVWSFPDGELLGSYKGHNGAVWSCSATFDSRWLVTCGADRLVIVWEARTSRELARVELPGVVRCVEWAGAAPGVNASDVSERFVTCHNRFGAHPPALSVWRFDGKAIQELIVIPKLPSAANQVRWGRANYFIASAHDSGELIFWRADTGAEVKRLKAHDAGISKFDFNDDRELVATVSHDMSVCMGHRKRLLEVWNGSFCTKHRQTGHSMQWPLDHCLAPLPLVRSTIGRRKCASLRRAARTSETWLVAAVPLSSLGRCSSVWGQRSCLVS